MKILLVDDDHSITESVKEGLKASSHTVEVSHDGSEASFLGRCYDYDVIILDYSLPKKNGLVVCEEIRRAGKQTPIIFLSVTDDVSIKVTALKAGADDYMTKPFSVEELCARVNAVTRRPANIKSTTLEVEDLRLDTHKQTANRGNHMISLTRKELNLLEYFMRNRGVILSRSLILEHVWSADSDLLSNTIESHIRNLRRKLNVKNLPNLIGNIQGRGYVMDSPLNLKTLQAR